MVCGDAERILQGRVESTAPCSESPSFPEGHPLFRTLEWWLSMPSGGPGWGPGDSLPSFLNTYGFSLPLVTSRTT